MRALVRPPSEAYARCIRRVPTPIDVARAIDQHAAYVEALRACGLEVESLPPEPEMPDACFIEDVAVIAGELAIVTRPGVPARAAEVERVLAPLSRAHRVVRMRRGRLDGGDVMIVGDAAFVGLTDRTDADGAAEIGRWLPVRSVTVPVDFLHLKSFATPIDDHTILRSAGEFPGCETIDAPEPLGANVLAHAGHVIVSAAAPQTAELLRRRGLQVHTVELDEFHKGDGMVTCMSLILDA